MDVGTKDMNQLDKFGRFAQRTVSVLKEAEAIAAFEGKKRVTLRHLILALIRVPNTAGRLVLLDVLGVEPNKVVSALSIKKLPEKPFEGAGAKQLGIDPSVREVLLEAVKLSKKSDSYYVGTEHIVLSLLAYVQKNKKRFPRAYQALNLEDVTLDQVIFNVLQKSLTPFRVLEQRLKQGAAESAEKPIKSPMADDVPEDVILKTFVKDVFKEAREVTGGKMFSRNKYTEEILRGFASALPKNVLLVGPSGVGKTFVVYDLVTKIAKREVPVEFQNLRILRVNMAEIIATSKFPLDIEKRIMSLINFAYDRPDIVLFFEDAHLLTGGRGGINLLTVLRPILESGKVKILGTVSDDDIRVLENAAPGLMRLFHLVYIDEPTPKEVVKILKMYAESWRSKFNVKISDAVLKDLVKLCDEYMPSEVFPYKAIKVLDSVITKKLVKVTEEDRELTEVSKQIRVVEQLKGSYLDMGKIKELEQLEKQSELLQLKKEALEDIKRLRLEKGVTVRLEDIRNHLAEVTGLPIYVITSQEAKALKELEDNLKKRIVAQDEAVKKVAYAVKRGRLNIVKGNRPWASFLFLGPTGVGKSELAKVLARYLFGDDKERLIQIDMSEFMESHSVSRLIGSPPGYVGFEQGGYLTERIKENPYSVVLFDEIEKAADNVLNILLQILEDGHLTDSKGDTVSFKNTIVILTSNIGAEDIFKDRVLGFYREAKLDLDNTEDAYENMRETLLKQLYKKLRPELINRLDDIIIFRTLTLQDAAKILEIILEDLNQRLKESLGVTIEVSPKAKKYLTEKGFSKEFGARALRRVVQTYVENSLVDYLLEQDPTALRPTAGRKRRKLKVDLDKKKRIVISEAK